MGNGDSVDDPQRVNLTNPAKTLRINGMDVDMHKFKEAADQLDACAYDVFTIDGYRNAQGDWVPNYESVRIVKRHKQ